MEKIQLGIAEDHYRYRKVFIKDLKTNYGNEIEVMLEAENGRDLLEQLKVYQPQIILMDIRMPVMDGMEAALLVRDLYPKIKVIVFTQFDFENNIIEMNQLGARSFIGKSQPREEMIKAIRIVHQGGSYMPEEIAKIWSDYLLLLRQRKGDVKIDDKERELLKMLCRGMSSTKIGEVVNKSPRTVEEHCANLRKKFNVANKEQLIALVSKNKIV